MRRSTPYIHVSSRAFSLYEILSVLSPLRYRVARLALCRWTHQPPQWQSGVVGKTRKNLNDLHDRSFLPVSPSKSRTEDPATPTARPDPAPAFFLLAAVGSVGLDRTIPCLLDPAQATALKLFSLVPSLPHLDNWTCILSSLRPSLLISIDTIEIPFVLSTITHDVVRLRPLLHAQGGS